MNEEKIKLSPYEIMTLMGATKPQVSDQLKKALDAEILNPQYEGLKMPFAAANAVKFLAKNKPEVFDPSNQDDMAVLHLAPFTFNDKGERVSIPDIVKLADAGSIQIAYVDYGDYMMMEVMAMNEEEARSCEIRMEKETPTEAPEFHVPVVTRYHSDPADESLEESIARLKEKVLDETSFAVSFKSFMTESERDSRFFKRATRVKKGPNLKIALENISFTIFPKQRPRVTGLDFFHLRNHAFMHGEAVLNGHSAKFFFFQDLNYGMTAVEMDIGQVIFSRLVGPRQSICRQQLNKNS